MGRFAEERLIDTCNSREASVGKVPESYWVRNMQTPLWVYSGTFQLQACSTLLGLDRAPADSRTEESGCRGAKRKWREEGFSVQEERRRRKSLTFGGDTVANFESSSEQACHLYKGDGLYSVWIPPSRIRKWFLLQLNSWQQITTQWLSWHGSYDQRLSWQRVLSPMTVRARVLCPVVVRKCVLRPGKLA